ncbi:hypothetical protein SAMN05192553_102681 [Cyclobacterium xiamenense]|uniref:Phage terminase large subunit n=1 Tax=Cyclobacterium xiamenense TaxID=1297121 RepID=A0A1H6WFU3_9BACT|nr:hypothetical protein [Cyclobacterium xiamenense]SEJ15909.1 hypothetical protein SAMN05192553_102681 [Cyclobacterium xiamenense]
MSWRKKPKENSPGLDRVFANWLSQVCMMILPKSLYMVAGRGSAKTTDIQVERLLEMVYDLPGAPVAWVADTYSNLQKNVLRTVKEGLTAKGMVEGVHYVIGKRPPEIPQKERPDLPPELKEHFWMPYNEIGSYRHTIVFFTGFNITFGSLDRPASLAGGNYVHVFGDEVKYFRKERILNLQKAVRGMRVKYGHSVFYRGHTFTTDMPNVDQVGEYDWVLERGNRMNTPALLRVLRTAFVVNEALGEYYAACEEGTTEEIIAKKRTWQRWVERWTATRLAKEAHSMFYIASSYVNVDILTPDWFEDAFNDDFIDAKTTVLSLKPSPETGELFYANLGERHFYQDGTSPDWEMRFGLQDEEDCRILKYHDRSKAIDMGLDFGNMHSMTLAQEIGKHYRVSKFIYTLSPEWIRELADKFLAFYKPHREKVVHLYYDRAANNYKKAGQDLATQLKKALEVDGDGNRTGWKVILMSEGQGNIGQNEEYNFMQELFQEHNRKLPRVLIDYFHCKPLRCSLQLAKTKKRTDRGRNIVSKDKSGEKLPIHRLPLESTNPSDSFKYLMMRKTWRRHVRGARKPEVGDASVRG